MSESRFNLDFNAVNNVEISSTRKIPICLVLDTSGSMTKGNNIRTLNENLQGFLDFVRSNSKSRRIADISIVVMGGGVEVFTEYQSIDNINFEKPFEAHGNTPMGEAMNIALDLLLDRREFYRNNEIEHYKPIILLMSDGFPTDQYQEAARRTFDMVMNKEIKLYPVGIGNEFDARMMREFSPIIAPKVIHNKDEFALLFQLLSQSSSNPEDDSLDQFFNDEF
jgi:uncharacterized protein YegL